MTENTVKVLARHYVHREDLQEAANDLKLTLGETWEANRILYGFRFAQKGHVS